MTEREDEFVRLLLDAHERRQKELGVRRLSDSEVADWLDVNPASYNMWINGRRRPDYASAIVLSKKLGPKVFDVLGYERVYTKGDPEISELVEALNDPDLRFIFEHWRKLDAATQQAVLSILNGPEGEKPEGERMRRLPGRN